MVKSSIIVAAVASTLLAAMPVLAQNKTLPIDTTGLPKSCATCVTISDSATPECANNVTCACGDTAATAIESCFQCALDADAVKAADANSALGMYADYCKNFGATLNISTNLKANKTAFGKSGAMTVRVGKESFAALAAGVALAIGAFSL